MGRTPEAEESIMPEVSRIEQPYIINNLVEAENLAAACNVPIEDIMLMGLNLSGVRSSEIADSRIRFKLQLKSRPEIFYLALCVNTKESPFEYKDDKINFGGEDIGCVLQPEKDTCDSTYFRRGKTELTLNSNSRSSCRGCKMCGTYSQEAGDSSRLSTENTLTDCLGQVFQENQLTDASGLYRVTICTGCFGAETAAVEHILLVNRVLKKFGFSGILRYLGSEIVSEPSLDTIQREVGNFALSITTEVFTRREELLKRVKSRVSVEQIKQVLLQSCRRGFRANILYVLGLEPLNAVVGGFEEFAQFMNEFPIINLMQNYLPEHERLRDPAARSIDYYLTARKQLERIFIPTGLRPQSWENYRPLWYLSFADEQISGARI